MTDADKLDYIRAEVSRVHESAMFSAQTQFEYSKTWRSVDRWLGGAAALLAAISAAGGLSGVFSATWAGLIALVAAGSGAVAAALGAPKTKDRAAASASAYLALQQDARILLRIDLDDMTVEDVRQDLSSLVARLQELNASSEVPSGRAWTRAKKIIDEGGQTYAADTEKNPSKKDSADSG